MLRRTERRREQAAVLLRLASREETLSRDAREERVVLRIAALEIRLARVHAPPVGAADRLCVTREGDALAVRLTAALDAVTREAPGESRAVAVVRAREETRPVVARAVAAVRIGCTLHAIASGA